MCEASCWHKNVDPELLNLAKIHFSARKTNKFVLIANSGNRYQIRENLHEFVVVHFCENSVVAKGFHCRFRIGISRAILQLEKILKFLIHSTESFARYQETLWGNYSEPYKNTVRILQNGSANCFFTQKI